MAGKKAKPVPDLNASCPIMPRSLKGKQAKFWKLIVPLLHEENYLKKIDGPALDLLCDSWCFYQEIKEKISADTLTAKTEKNNIIQHPLISVRNSAYKQLAGMLTEFGMTPSARVKMTRIPAGDENQLDLPLNTGSEKPQAGVVPPEIQAKIDSGEVVGTS